MKTEKLIALGSFATSDGIGNIKAVKGEVIEVWEVTAVRLIKEGHCKKWRPEKDKKEGD